MMTSQPVLVTGATGATGGYTIDALTKYDVSIRAMVRKDDDRAAKLRAAGVEVVLGDLLDLDSVRSAMEDIGAAYFVYPLVPGLIDATTYFAQAAREAGLNGIVNMSQISARRDSKSHQARDHWISERVFDWSCVPVTHLRPTFFTQWLTYPRVRHDIAQKGLISLPFGNARHAPIAAEDQARVIAAILTNPAPHSGKTYKLFGPVEMDQHGVAKAVGDALGREVIYEPIGIADFRRQLEQFGLPEQTIQHLCAVALDFQEGLFAGTNDVIETITGMAPMTVQSFVKAHKAEFNN
ncbi:MAG: NmrA family NAD(P)-binding protein [Chroococcidiopsidaceae cyanobacterium CP_BM_RX_35]|nr:NmrA family NAD(P)-binding protein [Chroococcidiopsidaceae cyanobacterium CP_BM_RX_35]